MSTVLVTGGSGGIGRAICLAFALEGFDIAFCYDKNGDGAEETAELLRKAGAGVQVFHCDVSDEKSVEEMFSSVYGLEILVNNAGISSFGLIQEISLAQWERVFRVNMTGAFLCTRAAIPKLLRRGNGCIVNISSMWGEVGASCEAVYSSCKAGIIGFTKALAKELGPSGIRVNCVSPGVIDTDMNKELDDETINALCRDTPLMRIGSPEDVAGVIGFLASPDSGFITGQVLPVNGGII